ncbi:MAG TPA: hypothetical protein VHG91_10105, partial [Longimicrobium sp.]|nr:hypothetical protein [Longimicrobium sp.]
LDAGVDALLELGPGGRVRPLLRGFADGNGVLPPAAIASLPGGSDGSSPAAHLPRAVRALALAGVSFASDPA